MATGTEAAEKAFRSAEERFLASDLDGALRVSRNAKRHLASLPALQNALTAYEVHAADRGGKRNCWYAVLGVGGGGGRPEPVTHDHDAIKKRYKRLCLVLHPDKNRSAAADGAFKLLQRAWEALSARHPPGRTGGPSPDPGTGAKPRPPGAPDSDWWSYFRYKPPPERTWSSYGYTPPPPPPPFSSASSGSFNSWRSRYASKRGTAYCGHCGSGPESAAGGGTPGGRCHACGTDFNPPPPPPRESSQAEGAAEPPPPRRAHDDGEKFRCPTECCRCKTPFSSLVSCTGRLCKVKCQACSYDAYVYVHNRHRATAF